jgi:peptidoglycan/xylan/chitin deacetylase (PgdA/CDA1 family)
MAMLPTVALDFERRCAKRLLLLGLSAAFSALLFPATPSLAGLKSANQCWLVNALAYRQGERAIHKNIAAAIVAPPAGKAIAAQNAGRTPLGAIRRVELPPGSRKLVALTFDLCEQPHEISGYQGDIVDFLRAQNVKATFFAGGKWLLTHAERSQQLMSDPLFEIGNHSWEHRNLRVVSEAVLTNEIVAPQLAYQTLRAGLAAKHCQRVDDTVLAHERAPEAIALFRFPYGACNPRALKAVAAQGLTAIQWDVSAGDPWPRVTAPVIIKSVLSHVRPGSIIIFHANGRGWHTSEALPKIVTQLSARGFEFVTVSELLRAGKPVIESRCYDAKPGDTDRYDSVGRRQSVNYTKRTGSPIRTDPDRGAPSREFPSLQGPPAWSAGTENR